MELTEEFKTSGTVYNTTFDKSDFSRLEKLLIEESEIQAQHLSIHDIKINFLASTLKLDSFTKFFNQGDIEARGNPSYVEVGATARDDSKSGWTKYISLTITDTEVAYYITGVSQTWVLGKREELVRFFKSKQVRAYNIPPIVASLARFIATVTAYLGVNGLLQQRYLTGIIVLLVSSLGYLSIDSARQRLNSSIPSGIFFLERPVRKVNYPLLQLCISLLAVLVTLGIGILNLSKPTP